jgi:N,N'-diacetyllegionaminate synthase
MNEVKIGLVTDLRNYQDYVKKFAQESKDKVMEIHLLESDLDDKFEQDLIELRQFVLSKGVEKIAFHSVDRIMQSVLYEEAGYEEDKVKFEMLMEGVKKFSVELGSEVLLVVHQGGKYPRTFIENMSEEEIVAFRKTKLAKAKVAYNRIKEMVQDSLVTIGLENSPPTCASKPEDHFMDICFEDFQERLGDDGVFVLDICHAAMAIEYYKQNSMKFRALDLLGDVPESLQSLEKYIELAGKNTKWIHISDATGMLGKDEGHVIGVDGGVINFKKIMKAIKKHVKNPVGVLELLQSHQDYSLISRSLEKLREAVEVRIADKVLNKDNCFLVAEIASSHCGDKEKLKHIVSEMAKAKADGIKFQIFSASDLCSTKHPGFNDLQGNQFSDEVWNEVLSYAKQFNVPLFADVFDEKSADLANEYIDVFSIHASDISNPFLLKHVALKGKPMLLYIGGSTLSEISEAIKVVEEFGNDIILVYGLQNFPTNIHNVHLKRIKKLEEKFGLPVCYHDHTDAETALAHKIAVHAFAYGAQMVEKHVTDDRSLKGFDYMSSLNPEEFAQVKEDLTEFASIIGKNEFLLHDADMEYRTKMKKFIVARTKIAKGDEITSEKLAYKRVSGGEYHPSEWSKVVGRQANQDIEVDAPIRNQDVVRKAVILVPVRMKSKRLPNKATLDLAGDSTIGQMLLRLKNCTKAEVVLCTSTEKEDAVLLEIAAAKGIKSFAGSSDDVMDRFMKCAERESAEIIVRATGDNPLMDPELIDRQIEYHIANNADYTGVEDVPIGFNAEVVSLNVLKKAREHVRNPRDTEYMTWFIKDPAHFKVMVMPVAEEERGSYRLTLDTPADLEVIRKVYAALYTPGKVFSVKETVQFLKDNPEISLINQNYKQVWQPPKLKEMV